jgi:PAS domain S-box-containing protein
MDLSRLLWDENPDAVLAVSSLGTVVFWSRAAETIFGYTQEEAMGRPLNDLIMSPDPLS